ncbi:MAG TPA: alpha-E domain-containing protein [Ohtaekwangia sp.]|uniref:alpha-E domain-containing protein n=1 Tax=Ohtaekwangia sp. TaxID=2066019 RepID=UPI002F959A27
MLSRVADSLYWMSRYIERTDSTLRTLMINHLSSQDNLEEFTWRPVLRIFSSLEEPEITKIERNGRQVLQYMVLSRDNPNSVASLVIQARENARSVQDNITKELWQSLNEFYHIVRDQRLKKSLQYDDPVTVLDSLIKQCMLYYGVTDITMFRGEGICFMNLGKYLERAIQSADILDIKFNDLSYDLDKTTDTTYWKYLLMSVSGYALYLKRYRSGFEARNIVDQVLFNIDFPRSILYSVNQLHRYFGRLKNDQNMEGYNKVDFLIGKLRSKLQYSDVDSVSKIGLHHYLTGITTDIYEIGNTLNQHYFAYS